MDACAEAMRPGFGTEGADLGEVVRRRLTAVVALTGGEVIVQEALVRAQVLVKAIPSDERAALRSREGG